MGRRTVPRGFHQLDWVFDYRGPQLEMRDEAARVKIEIQKFFYFGMAKALVDLAVVGQIWNHMEG